MINKKKIVIGTSSWGSKISFKKSLELGEKLTSLGLNHFDTAPTYGAGNSHYILNKLGKNDKIFIDTKYGQLTDLTPKEIAKRFYRFINFESFIKSFEFLKTLKEQIKIEDLWSIKNVEKYLNKFTNDLHNCEIITFYLHSPPYEIINKDYLLNFINLIESKNILPGISWPDNRNVDFLLNNFSNIKLQLSIDQFQKSKDKINNKNQFINLNSIFRNRNLEKKYQNKLNEEVIQFLNMKENNKIIIGLNSNKSLEKLNELLLSS